MTGADDVVVSPNVSSGVDADSVDVFPEETADLVLVGLETY